MDVPALDYNEFEDFIKMVVTTYNPEKNCFGTPVIVHGDPGIGKSSILRQIFTELGYSRIYDIRLTNYLPDDIGGIKVPDFKNKKVQVFPPIFYNEDTYIDPDSKEFERYAEEFSKTKKIPKGVNANAIIFDEINSCPPEVSTAAFRVIQERIITDDGKKLGPFDVIVACGNYMNDTKSHTYVMPAPLANRFLHVRLVPDKEQWIERMGSLINPLVAAYIKTDSTKLFSYNDVDIASNPAFPTPRSWMMVSNLLNNMGIYTAPSPHDKETIKKIKTIAASAIGEREASNFVKTVTGFLSSIPPFEKAFEEFIETRKKGKPVVPQVNSIETGIAMCTIYATIIVNKATDLVKKDVQEKNKTKQFLYDAFDFMSHIIFGNTDEGSNNIRYEMIMSFKIIMRSLVSVKELSDIRNKLKYPDSMRQLSKTYYALRHICNEID